MNDLLHDYFKIIHKYIPPGCPTYGLFMTHAALVTAKALQAARHLNLSVEQMRFIEEAAMLHDIGVVSVNAPELGCSGELPYIMHIVEGGRILRDEGLPRHARVAESHIGAGITCDDVTNNCLPLPVQDYVPQTIEEELISWADLFYSKNPDSVWSKRKKRDIRANLRKYGREKVGIFNAWNKRFRK